MIYKRNSELTVIKIAQPTTRPGTPLPAFLSAVQAGFPSPAEDYIENSLDLNELVVQHPTATFFVRVEGESMVDANIHSGDILVVDRSKEAISGMIVVAVVNSEFTVKRLVINPKGAFLMPENKKYPEIKLGPDADVQIWGVVTYVVHKA